MALPVLAIARTVATLSAKGAFAGGGLASVEGVVNVAGEAIGILGVDNMLKILHFAGKHMRGKAAEIDGAAAAEMIALMRSRVSVDTGRLLNDLDAREEDGFWVVSSGPEGRYGRDFGGSDDAGRPFYAPFHEYGTEFNEAHPYFWPSVNDVAAKRNLQFAGMLGDLGNATGLAE